MRISDWSSDVCSSDLEVRLRATGSRADERTPAVLAGRTGWGGVPWGSARTVATPSRTPPAFAGGGALHRAGATLNCYRVRPPAAPDRLGPQEHPRIRPGPAARSEEHTSNSSH